MKGKLSLTVDRRAPGQAILRVEGSVDAATFKEFESAFEGLNDVLYLVVDMAKTDYLSSSAFSLLIKTKTDRAGKKGDVILVQPQASILNIIKILGMQDFFRVAASADEALRVRD